MPEAICQRCGDDFDQDQQWKKICFPCWKATKGKEYKKSPVAHQSTGSAQIDPELLKRLIMLCHPDKHGQSQMSLTVTQQL